MTALQQALAPLAAVVREASAVHCKPARLELSCGDIAVDDAFAERLRCALAHLVRQAVCERLEDAAGRRRAKKVSPGTCLVKATRGPDALTIVLIDDGAGTPPDPARARPFVEALRGTIEIDVIESMGSRLSLRFPAAAASSAPAASSAA